MKLIAGKTYRIAYNDPKAPDYTHYNGKAILQDTKPNKDGLYRFNLIPSPPAKFGTDIYFAIEDIVGFTKKSVDQASRIWVVETKLAQCGSNVWKPYDGCLFLNTRQEAREALKVILGQKKLMKNFYRVASYIREQK